MKDDKFKNLLLILGLTLIIIGIPYLLYTLGSFIEINYFGYLNNWWVVLLFILTLITVFIFGGIDLDKNISTFFLLFFTVPFFILGMRLGKVPSLDLDTYALLLDKEREVDRLDSILLELENEFRTLEEDPQVESGLASKNHEIIFFSYGSSQLSEFNKEKITNFISNLSNCTLAIKGYTDGSGTKAANLDISKKRAQRVADFIQSINSKKHTISLVTGLGDEDKLVENKNESARSKNRRVTIEVISRIDSKKERIRKEMVKTRADLKSKKAERNRLKRLVNKSVGM